MPEVTLVGVVSADIALNLPDERAAERTYQLLAQAVGRAGRGDRRGRAIVQTYRPEHRAIRAVVEGDADAFYDEELELRERFGSPPFGRLVKLTVALSRSARRPSGRASRWPTRLRGRAADGGPRRPGRRTGARLRRPPRRALAVQRRPPRARTRSPCSIRRRARRGRSTSTRSRSCRPFERGARGICKARTRHLQRDCKRHPRPCRHTGAMPDRVFRGLRSVLLAVAVTALVVVGRVILDQLVGPRGWYVACRSRGCSRHRPLCRAATGDRRRAPASRSRASSCRPPWPRTAPCDPTAMIDVILDLAAGAAAIAMSS